MMERGRESVLSQAATNAVLPAVPVALCRPLSYVVRSAPITLYHADASPARAKWGAIAPSKGCAVPSMGKPTRVTTAYGLTGSL
jgi:hypothetical protein